MIQGAHRNFTTSLTFADYEGCLDSQQTRASELVEIGESRAAARVATCGQTGPFGGVRSCKDRSCPRCAVNRSRRDALRVFEKLKPYASRTHVVAGLSACTNQLVAGVAQLRSGLARLRRHKFMQRIDTIGAVELCLTHPQTWWVHAHLALANLGDVEQLLEAWSQVTEYHGKASLDPAHWVKSPAAFSKYVTKPEGWSPPRSAEVGHSHEDLSCIRAAIKGRRRVIAWKAQS